MPELDADEYEYVLTTAEVSFYRRVQSDVNRIIGYSTDAMTITNADKPYANLSQTIAELLGAAASAVLQDDAVYAAVRGEAP